MTLKRFVSLAGMLIFISSIFLACDSNDTPIETVEECGIAITSPLSVSGPWNYLAEIKIRWEVSGPADLVSIVLTKDNNFVGTICDTTANDGYYRWVSHTFGQNNATDYTISVTTLGTTPCSDISENLELVNTHGCNISYTGSVAAFADLLRPYSINDTINITWDSFNATGNVTIELLQQFDDVSGIIAYNIPDDGSFSWPVTSFHNGDYNAYKIFTFDMGGDGCSVQSGHFEIHDDTICSYHFISPSANNVLTTGSEQEILFELQNMSGSVDLWLYSGNEPISPIASNVSVNATIGRFLWLVDTYDFVGPVNMYRIKAFAGDDYYCSGFSGSFTITQP